MRLGKTADRPLSYLYAMLSGRVIALLLSFAGAQGLKYTTDIEAAFREAQKNPKTSLGHGSGHLVRPLSLDRSPSPQ